MCVPLESGAYVSPSQSPVGRRRANSQSSADRNRDHATPTKSRMDGRMVIVSDSVVVSNGYCLGSGRSKLICRW